MIVEQALVASLAFRGCPINQAGDSGPKHTRAT